ncbi:MAG: response regulator transcription factor, partial [Sulfuricella sp.]|nr:response regulator transcription factor [Sulfuricella sp.]
MKRRIAIVDDHAMFRDGLRAILARDGEVEIVGEADNGRDAIRLAGLYAPDAVLMDLSMPGMNGIEAIREIKRRYPATRVLVLTMHNSDAHVRESRLAGADGYILKEAKYGELRIALRRVLSGKSYWSPDVAAKAFGERLGGSMDALTPRERQVLKLVAEGHPNRHVADYLCLSVKTVEK